MPEDSGIYSIDIGRKRVSWDLTQGKLTSAGALAVILWLQPSLRNILQPLIDELGVPLFRLLIAYHSHIGAEHDYNNMVRAAGGTFAEGFAAWSRAVAASGWGKIELAELDHPAQRARVRVKNPWELQMQGEIQERWGCPFLQGKIIGIFSLALGVGCWADEVAASVEGSCSHVEFYIYPSQKTIAGELEALRRSQKQAMRRRLAEMSHELFASESRQKAIIDSLGEVVYTLSPEGRFTTYHVPKETAAFVTPAAEVVGRLVEEVFLPDVAARLRAALIEVLGSDASRTISYERERDGQTRYFNAKMSSLHGQDGATVGVTVIERDLTEQVLAEHALAERLAVIEQQREAIRAMSTPILEVGEGTLALPIQGAIDQQRAVAIMEDLLSAIQRQRARLLLLDLTAVDAIDAATAAWFDRLIRAAGLLGVECFLCGIRPSVAQAMAKLQLDVGSTQTFQTMRSALAAALRRTRAHPR